MRALDSAPPRMFSPLSSPVFAFGLKFGVDHSTTAGLVISGLLIVVSLVCWSMLAAKAKMLSHSRKANSSFVRAFHHSAHPLALFQECEHHSSSPAYHIYHAGSRELAFHLVGTDEPDMKFASRLQSAARITPSQMNAVRLSMERAATETALRLNDRMAGIASIIRCTPWLGLLGSVWALLDGLSGVSAANDASSSALTTAVGGALLPLLISLLVAVPGWLAHQFVTSKIEAVVARGEHFISEFSSVLQRHFVDHRITPEALPSIGSLGTPNMPAFGKVRVETEIQTSTQPGAAVA